MIYKIVDKWLKRLAIITSITYGLVFGYPLVLELLK